MIALGRFAGTAAVLLTLLVAQSIAPARAQSVRVFEYSRGRSPIAMVFIHGLAGCAVPSGQKAGQWCPGSQDTFRIAEDQPSWPEIIAADSREISRGALRDLLGSVTLRVRDLGVWGIDYNRLTRFPCAAFSIPEVAQAVRAQLEASPVFARYEQVIIVAHSMGGLITKEMMLSWAAGEESRGRFLNRVAAVMLLGVPSQGSPLAEREGIFAFFRDTLRLHILANACKRQINDLFPGDANTYLVDLERRWESMVGARRLKNSLAPLRYCAYEKIAEPVVGFVVPLQYAFTQCDDSQFPLAVPHTQLPKPTSATDDVHHAWFYNSLSMLFTRWSFWTGTVFDFGTANATLETFAAFVNRAQDAVQLELDGVSAFAPAQGRYSAPDAFALVANVVAKNRELCLDMRWPADERGILTIRTRGKCTN